MDDVVELIEMIVGAVIFSLTMLTFIFYIRGGISENYKIAAMQRNNTTIVQNYKDNMVLDNYKPVVKHGKDYFEGQLLGSTMIAEIKSLPAETEVFINNQSLNVLTYNGQEFLTYVRTYNDSPLKNLVIENKEYLRAYTYNPDGSIQRITYRFK